MHLKLVGDDDVDDDRHIGLQGICLYTRMNNLDQPLFSHSHSIRMRIIVDAKVSTHLTPSSYFSQFGKSFDFTNFKEIVK